MTIKYQDILKILDQFEQSNLKNMSLKDGDFELVVSKTHSLTGLTSLSTPPAALIQPPAGNPAASTPVMTTAMSSSAPSEVVPKVDVTDVLEIKSPMVGTFYTTPDPKSAPFIALGDVIEADTTVGIIEVMKVFNAIEAKVAGEVVEIMIEHEATVEFGQPLFRVRPL